MQEMEGEGEKIFSKKKYMNIVHTCINAFLQNVAFFISVVIVKNNIILSYVQSLSLCKK